MSNNLAVVETRKPPLMAGARPVAIVPQSMEEAYRLAQAVCVAGMAPKGLDTPEKAMVAILHGLEVGLTPMAALQRIAVVNGRPTIWGDGAMGLVRGSGACEFIHETLTGDGDKMAATCEAKRKGESDPIVGRFSVDDAKKAGLWGKQGPWQQFPKRMLQMRARAFALRDGFADVLGGLYLREEIEDDSREARRPPPPQQTYHPAAIETETRAAIEGRTDAGARPASSSGPRRAPPPPAARLAPPEPKIADKVADEVDCIDATEALAEFTDAAEICRDEGSLNELWDDLISPIKAAMPPPDAANADLIYRKALARVQG